MNAKKIMEIVVDGIIFQTQSRGGISRIYHEILPRMCDIDSSLKVEIFVTGLCLQQLPTHPQINQLFPAQFCQFLYPHWFWQKFIQRFLNPIHRISNRETRGKIWHSTYYTNPDHWAGHKVVTVVDMIHERIPYLFEGPHYNQLRERKRESMLEAEAIICISETTRKDILGIYGVDPKKIFVVPLAHSDAFVKVDNSENRPGSRINRPFLLYVGGRQAYKNFQGFVKLFRDWSVQNDTMLVIVGEDLTKRERRLINELGIKNRLIHYKNIDDKKLNILYNRAKALIYPSSYEGFGIPLLEAMASGCPIVASRIPSTVEVAGDLPIYFEIDKPESLHMALDEVASSNSIDERIGAGFEWAKRYTWNRTARRTLEVYYSVM